ncbi:sensor histidine kinase [Tenacibaculum amylolyticum]|uniref:sensor histidine kinase n=1 Tax=Tenacibaculum amylolyticum TaxID=104269 RepID=UPI0038942AF6
MILDFLKRLGKLEPFEIKNSSLVLILMSPGIYLYSVLIFRFNPHAIEVPYLRELFAVFYMIVGLLPFLKKKFVEDYYGIFVFIALLLFQHYLTYTTAINDFSLDYLLGTYIVMFGAILMLNVRVLIILFSTLQLLHMGYQVLTSQLDLVTEGAILISTTTIYVYSFIILNGFIRYRKNLQEVNMQLEDRIKLRTQDLENRAKELYERNKDLEEFAYVVSHDLKRPLRNIYTLADWLTEDNEDEFCKESAKENLTMMKDQVEEMDMLINGVLNYSLQMQKEHDLEKVDVDRMIKRISKLNSSNKCKIEVKEELPIVVFNESRLMQVFHNLIQNAIKHNDKDVVEIKIGCEEKESEYCFFVKDNGPGIDEKYHEKIFHLFQKLEIKSNIESIGIGLALVKKIVERNKGKVWLESEKGKGCAFFFSVPK